MSGTQKQRGNDEEEESGVRGGEVRTESPHEGTS